MIVILATLTFDAEKVETAKGLAREMAQATLQEAGCRRYAFSVDLDDPHCLHLSEWWDDDDAISTHFATPHMAKFRKALRELGVKGSDMKRFDVSAAGNLDMPPSRQG
jgi:quinol monooxygenase YgiN